MEVAHVSNRPVDLLLFLLLLMLLLMLPLRRHFQD
jgi:hypothetical protein